MSHSARLEQYSNLVSPARLEQLKQEIALHPVTPIDPESSYFQYVLWARLLQEQGIRNGVHIDPYGKKAAIGETALKLLNHPDYDVTWVLETMVKLLVGRLLPAVPIGEEHTTIYQATANGLTRNALAGPDHPEKGRLRLQGLIQDMHQSMEAYFSETSPNAYTVRDLAAKVNEETLPKLLALQVYPDMEPKILKSVAAAGRDLFTHFTGAVADFKKFFDARRVSKEVKPVLEEFASLVLNKAEARLKELAQNMSETDLKEYLITNGDVALRAVYSIKQGKLTPQDFPLIVKVLYIAGQAPVTIGTEATLFKVLRSPEIMERLSQEIEAHSESAAAFAGYIYRENTLLKAVIECSLAVTPPLYELYRERELDLRDLFSAPDEFGAKLQGRIVANLIATGMSIPAWGNDPLGLHPDAYMSASHQERALMLPYGAGPRVCAGFNVANLEMKTMIALLILQQRACKLSFDTNSLKNNQFTANPIHLHLRDPLKLYRTGIS